MVQLEQVEVEQEDLEHLFQVELKHSFFLFRSKYSSNNWSRRSFFSTTSSNIGISNK
jgi:hypothetical protein